MMAAKKKKKKRGPSKTICIRSAKEIQILGPAKTVCKRRVARGSKAGRAFLRKKKKIQADKFRWCVYLGKEQVSCHRKKGTASKRMRSKQKTCRGKVRVRRTRIAA